MKLNGIGYQLIIHGLIILPEISISLNVTDRQSLNLKGTGFFENICLFIYVNSYGNICSKTAYWLSEINVISRTDC